VLHSVSGNGGALYDSEQDTFELFEARSGSTVFGGALFGDPHRFIAAGFDGDIDDG
jgi:hypothetical protein